MGAPSAPTDTRSERNAAMPGRQPSSRAARRSRDTAATVSRASVISIPSLKASTCRSGVTARSALETSIPSTAGRYEAWKLTGSPSTRRSRSSTKTWARSASPSGSATRASAGSV